MMTRRLAVAQQPFCLAIAKISLYTATVAGNDCIERRWVTWILEKLKESGPKLGDDCSDAVMQKVYRDPARIWHEICNLVEGDDCEDIVRIDRARTIITQLDRACQAFPELARYIARVSRDHQPSG